MTAYPTLSSGRCSCWLAHNIVNNCVLSMRFSQSMKCPQENLSENGRRHSSELSSPSSRGRGLHSLDSSTGGSSVTLPTVVEESGPKKAMQDSLPPPQVDNALSGEPADEMAVRRGKNRFMTGKFCAHTLKSYRMTLIKSVANFWLFCDCYAPPCHSERHSEQGASMILQRLLILGLLLQGRHDVGFQILIRT